MGHSEILRLRTQILLGEVFRAVLFSQEAILGNLRPRLVITSIFLIDFGCNHMPLLAIGQFWISDLLGFRNGQALLEGFQCFGEFH